MTEGEGSERAAATLIEADRIWTKIVGSSSPSGLDTNLQNALRDLYDSGHKVIDIKLAANPERFVAMILYQKLLQPIEGPLMG